MQLGKNLIIRLLCLSRLSIVKTFDSTPTQFDLLSTSYDFSSESQLESTEEIDILEGLNNLPDLLYQQKFKPVGDHFVR